MAATTLLSIDQHRYVVVDGTGEYAVVPPFFQDEEREDLPNLGANEVLGHLGQPSFAEP